jgi:4-hydroxy-tetrahydrodipicolinate reductase
MKIAIAGCGGRMGLTLIKAAQVIDDIEVVAGSERHGSDLAHLQTQLAADGAANILLTSDADELVEAADAVIDFTTPAATLYVAEAVAKAGKIHVIGTTGFTSEEQRKLESYAKKAVIVQSGNFSLGINLLETLVEQAAKALSTQYDAEIFEMHHKQKKDSPSGTALMLGRAVAKGRNMQLDARMTMNREGERKKGDIGFSVARGGDVVGIHTVTFAGPGELIELKHQGFSRDIYANGALHAAQWAEHKKPGLYSMRDVLND